MSIDRCENALSAVRSLLTGKDWARSAEAPSAEVDGVTTVTVLLSPMTSSEAESYARELTDGMAELGYECAADFNFKGLRTVTQFSLCVRTGDSRSL